MIHVEVNKEAIRDLMGGNGDKVYVVQKDLPCGLRKGDEVSNTCLFSKGYEAVITRNNDGLLRQRVIYSKEIVEQNTDFFLLKEPTPNIIVFSMCFRLPKEQILFNTFDEADKLLDGALTRQKENNNGYKYQMVGEGNKIPFLGCAVADITICGYHFTVVDLSKYKV